MNATTVAVDLAKSVFQLAVADQHWKLIERARLTRSQFERWFVNRSVGLVVMEACGSAHHWARYLQRLRIAVRPLPPRYVRAYVKRNKTDAADAAALLEAARCADIQPVRIKSVEQQSLQSLHRIRSAWMATRTSRINALRGFCREFGLSIGAGSRLGIEQISRLLADPASGIPQFLRPPMNLLIEEIRLLEGRITQLEGQLTAAARQSPACETLLSVPGIGLLTATATLAATGGSVSLPRAEGYCLLLAEDRFACRPLDDAYRLSSAAARQCLERAGVQDLSTARPRASTLSQSARRNDLLGDSVGTDELHKFFTHSKDRRRRRSRDVREKSSVHQ